MFTSVLAFLVLYRYAGVASFWLDELFSVGSIRSELSFSEFINIYKNQETNSPLYFIFAFFWYRLVPHTEQALLSLPIFFLICAAIVTGLTGYKLSGIRVGIFSFLFILFNRANLAFAAYEFRAYSLLILVAAMNIYYYLSRLQDESWRNIILYGVTMSLLPYTHYVSVLLCLGLFLADCVLIAKKHSGFKVIASYFIGASLFLPWGIVSMIPRLGRYSVFSQHTPSFSELVNLLRWLSSSRSFFDLPFLLAAAGVIYIIYSVKNNKFLFIGLFASAFMLLTTFIYSRYINPPGSFFVNRYFFAFSPFISLTIASGADYLYTRLKPVFKGKNIFIFAVIIFAFCFVNLFHVRHERAGYFEPYREVADIIYQDEQLFKGKSAIVTTMGGLFFDGWYEMYLTRDHTREVPVIFHAGSKDDLEKIQSGNYERIYLCYVHTHLNQLKNQEIMDWLRKNYSFSNKIKGYDFNILERIQ